METKNSTYVTEFVLSVFTDNQKLQVLFFVLFLLVYIVTMLGNICIIVLVSISPHLHNPMYFFISNLSFSDFWYSSSVAPKLLVNLLSKRSTIPYSGCVVQMYFFASLATTESLLLSAMAYDRYIAICNPLLYPAIMTRRVCMQMVAAAYFGGFLQSAIQTCCTFSLSFCASNVISQFYCDIPPLLKLSCTSTYVNEVVIFVCGSFTSVGCLSIILVSYFYILSNVMSRRFKESSSKAFSTCVSHLIVIAMFYGTILFMYFRPTSSYSLEQDKVASIFYTLVIPMLNPLIYSMRNKDIKTVMLKAIRRKQFLDFN
ncbi:olfactory receptor 5AP2-like [Ambystoma mexicanum]|uniref:olfactory receptor 5AP2-like n=1 Tax=Ambystoma mexicanum TaxID=8296 RepID=UPI0037E95182